MAESSASDLVKTALTDLGTQAPLVIAAALGVAILVFGAKYLWRTAKGLTS